MKFVCTLLALVLFSTGGVHAADQAKQLTRVDPLPVALSDDFEFRKTKIYFLNERGAGYGGVSPKKKGGKSDSQLNPESSSGAVTSDASIIFERQFRLFGAVTRLDQRQRFGDYFDFFWRAKRTAAVTVRFEYQQEKLHAFTQGREVFYPHVRGTIKTEFAIIGDDYYGDGRVIAWRCSLIENGRIVAQNRSYLWE